MICSDTHASEVCVMMRTESHMTKGRMGWSHLGSRYFEPTLFSSPTPEHTGFRISHPCSDKAVLDHHLFSRPLVLIIVSRPDSQLIEVPEMGKHCYIPLEPPPENPAMPRNVVFLF